jgi:hypothetical protein
LPRGGAVARRRSRRHARACRAASQRALSREQRRGPELPRAARRHRQPVDAIPHAPRSSAPAAAAYRVERARSNCSGGTLSESGGWKPYRALRRECDLAVAAEWRSAAFVSHAPGEAFSVGRGRMAARQQKVRHS